MDVKVDLSIFCGKWEGTCSGLKGSGHIGSGTVRLEVAEVPYCRGKL